jgi:hypothetical protein
MELEPSNAALPPVSDSRKRMDEPLPVSLEAVADIHLPIPSASPESLDSLYVDILEFQKAADRPVLTYHADNFDLVFDLPRPEGQKDYRPVKIIVHSLVATEHKLVEAEIEYERQKSIMPGHEALVFTDPDGNYVETREHREVG